jgi:hypothetical protein
MARSWEVEVLVPETGQFLIGDSPAVALRAEGGFTTYGMAFGDAHTLVLPIGPKHLLAFGPKNVMVPIPGLSWTASTPCKSYLSRSPTRKWLPSPCCLP